MFHARALLTGSVISLALSLSACGGGDGQSAAPTPAPPAAGTPVPGPAPSLTPPVATPDCQTRDVYTLCVTLRDTRVSTVTLGHMTELFFAVYPRLVARFNRAAPLAVDFEIGPSEHIAYVIGNRATYSATWLMANPQDYDVVVHEIMHIVQSYTSSPGWLTEGIADYVRHHYGVNNAAAGWVLQWPDPGRAYTDGYGVTARFLVWVEERYQRQLVERLDAAIRDGSYDAALWVSLTGKSPDDLWSEYLRDPAIATGPTAGP